MLRSVILRTSLMRARPGGGVAARPGSKALLCPASGLCDTVGLCERVYQMAHSYQTFGKNK